MNDNVSHPGHYTQDRFGIECIEVIRGEVCTLANVVKYVWRHAEKNGLEDLRKAEQYLVWAIEDDARLTSAAKTLIWHYVEPVTHMMTDPERRVYRAIVDLSFDRVHTALDRIRAAIDAWPVKSMPLAGDTLHTFGDTDESPPFRVVERSVETCPGWWVIPGVVAAHIWAFVGENNPTCIMCGVEQ